LIATAVVVALLIDFRSRIAVALIVALALGIAQRTNKLETWPKSRLLAYLGKISYSVFLVNFPVGLVVNALFAHFSPDNTLVNALGMLIAWLACVLVGAAFHSFVESRTRQVQETISGACRLLLQPIRQYRPLQRLFVWLALVLRVRP
jgi:peptidoglycan/LPS O-acetylase OafA/YrhL